MLSEWKHSDSILAVLPFITFPDCPASEVKLNWIEFYVVSIAGSHFFHDSVYQFDNKFSLNSIFLKKLFFLSFNIELFSLVLLVVLFFFIRLSLPHISDRKIVEFNR
jgi:hypothetical protein